MKPWAVTLGVVLAAGFVACGQDHALSPQEPTPVGLGSRLPTPAMLVGRWATAADAPYPRPGDNVVVITPSYAKDDPVEVARLLAQVRLPAIVFAGHIYHNRRETWGQAWGTFSGYLKAYEQAGVLVGIQPLDEPAGYGQWGHVQPAIDDVRARGYRVLLTEIIDYVDESGHWKLRPPQVDWFAPTCYPYVGTRWNLETCEQELREHPEWNTLAIPAFLGDPAPWEEMAARHGRGRLRWE